MIAAAALIVGMIAAAILQGNVGPQVTAAICRLFGGDCASASEVAIDTKLPECELASTAYEGTAEASVFSVNLGGDATLTLKQVITNKGETKWVVEQAGSLKVGGHVMWGADAKVGLRAGASANLKAGLKAKGAASFDFTSEKEAQQFIQDVAKEAARYAGASMTGPAAPFTKWAIDQTTGGPLTYPPVSEYYVEGGLDVSGDLKAAAGLEASLAMSGSGALGTKVKPGPTPKDTEYTFYYKGNNELAAALGLADVGGKSELVVGVTYKDGKPMKASIDAAGNFDASWALSGELPKGNIFGQPGKGSIGVNVTGTKKAKLSLELDLTNTQNRDALANVFQSTSTAILPGSGKPGAQDPREAVAALRDRFAQGGPREGATFTVQMFDGATGEFEVGFFAGNVVAFGGGGPVSMTALKATDAAYYDPDVGGMARWRRCSGAG